MRNLVAIRFLALSLAACSASSARIAVVTSPAPSPEASPWPSTSPSPRPTARVLDIKLHLQQHNLTCEAAALTMALSYEGISVDEMTLIGYMTNDARPAKLDVQGHLLAWGDPAESFVGNPDGNIQRYTGYGVYFGPVAAGGPRAGGHRV